MPRLKTPASTYKKLLLRLPGDTLHALSLVAEEEHRSMNAQIVHVLMEWLRKEQPYARLRPEHD